MLADEAEADDADAHAGTLTGWHGACNKLSRMSQPAQIPKPVPSAAVILLRDGPAGIEVLMQRRREQASAFAGVVVFPGGKVAAIDSDPGFQAAADLGAAEPFEPARQLAALRELFEESAILLARGKDARSALLPHRERLDKSPELWPSLLAEHGLRVAADLLVPWARWVTPDFAPRRFDSTLFAAAAPADQAPVGGSEAEEYLWARPTDVLSAAEREEVYIVFVTRMNLMRLAQYATVAAALEAGRRGPYPTIQPRKAETPAGDMVRIPPEAPYPVHELPFKYTSTAVDARRREKLAGKP
jgi:8-oxo-dGTP pyrophosphatase MutT (NUDIX family)